MDSRWLVAALLGAISVGGVSLASEAETASPGGAELSPAESSAAADLERFARCHTRGVSALRTDWDSAGHKAYCEADPHCQFNTTFESFEFALPTWNEWSVLLPRSPSGPKTRYTGEGTFHQYLVEHTGGSWPVSYGYLEQVWGAKTGQYSTVPTLDEKEAANAFGLWMHGSYEHIINTGTGYVWWVWGPVVSSDFLVQPYAELYRNSSPQTVLTSVRA